MNNNKLIKDFLELNRNYKVSECIEDLNALLDRHEKILKTNRLQRFVARFKNQYRIHHSRFSIFEIIKIAFIQSKRNE